MRRLLTFGFLFLFSGCHRSPGDILAQPHTINGGLYVVMGQSNAVGIWEQANTALMAGLQAKSTAEVYGLNCAVSGSYIASWQPGQPNYDNCIVAVQKTGKPLAGIIFWQGEAEAEGADAAAANGWDVSFTNTATRFRNDLGKPNTPIVFARISDLTLIPLKNAVRGAQMRVSVVGATMLSVDDIPTIPNNLHYSSANYGILAKKFVDAF